MKTFQIKIGPIRFKFREIPIYLLKESLKRMVRFDFSEMGGVVYALSGRTGYYDYLLKKFPAPEGFDFNGIKIPSIPDKRTFISEFFDLLYNAVYKSDNFPYDEGPYEYGEVSLKKGDVVFDCGANVGMFSAFAANRGCMVYAFEPVPQVAAYLKKTADLNSGITICEAALTDKSGPLSIFVDLKNAGESSLHSGLPKNGEEIIVQGLTIDDFVKNNSVASVDFIKADIEGAERYMLAGAKNVLMKFAPKLSICKYHLPDDPEVLKKIILDANPTYTIVENWKKIYAFGAKRLTA